MNLIRINWASKTLPMIFCDVGREWGPISIESDIVQFPSIIRGCSFYRCSFDGKDGGEMLQIEYERYIKPEEADEETTASI